MLPLYIAIVLAALLGLIGISLLRDGSTFTEWAYAWGFLAVAATALARYSEAPWWSIGILVSVPVSIMFATGRMGESPWLRIGGPILLIVSALAGTYGGFLSSLRDTGKPVSAWRLKHTYGDFLTNFPRYSEVVALIERGVIAPDKHGTAFLPEEYRSLSPVHGQITIDSSGGQLSVLFYLVKLWPGRMITGYMYRSDNTFPGVDFLLMFRRGAEWKQIEAEWKQIERLCVNWFYCVVQTKT
ncbi:MAG: hypothetical protein GTO14_05800 [Anaerolineales bacterium]|nr:hypothetical protein [Anaerolineales bacterium]